MPASRIAFALGDLRSELAALIPEDQMIMPLADVHMPPLVYEKVVKELEYHHGGKLQKDRMYRGTAVRYAGMRLILEPLGNK